MHKKTIIKIRRAKRNRAKIHGTSSKPRVSIFRSNKYLHVQVIDDNAGKTLISVSSAKLDKKAKMTKTKQAEALGVDIAKKAKDMNIGEAVFDRSSYKYHGRVRAVAEGARSGGLKI